MKEMFDMYIRVRLIPMVGFAIGYDSFDREIILVVLCFEVLIEI